MNASRSGRMVRVGIILGAAMLWPGCTSEYSGGGDVDVHGSFYYGVGYGPGFYGPGWYGAGWYGMGGGMTTGSTSTIYVGQLALDMYSASQKQLVWRGVASKTLDQKAKPEKQHKNLAKAVTKLEGRVLDGTGKARKTTPGTRAAWDGSGIEQWRGAWELFDLPPGTYTLELTA